MSAWAKRKAAVQAEAKELARAEQAAVVAEQQATLAEKPEEEVLSELNLPNPDGMQAGDDFAAFMKSSVPAALRNRALRKLWTSDPVLANVDMLVDYGEDFTGKNEIFKLVNTVYRVGKGMLPDQEEVVGPEAVDMVPVAEDAQETPDVDETPAMTAIDENETAAPTGEIADVTETVDLAEEQFVAPRRRMRFSFADGTSPVNTEMEI